MFFLHKSFFSFAIFSILLGVVFLPSAASAEDCKPGLIPCGRHCDVPKGASNIYKTEIDETQMCTICHMFFMAQALVDWLMEIVVFVALLVISAAGVVYVLSGGSSMTSYAKRMITNSLKGIAIMLVAYLGVSTTFALIGVDGKIQKGWNSFTCDMKTRTPAEATVAKKEVSSPNKTNNVIVSFKEDGASIKKCTPGKDHNAQGGIYAPCEKKDVSLNLSQNPDGAYHVVSISATGSCLCQVANGVAQTKDANGNVSYVSCNNGIKVGGGISSSFTVIGLDDSDCVFTIDGGSDVIVKTYSTYKVTVGTGGSSNISFVQKGTVSSASSDVMIDSVMGNITIKKNGEEIPLSITPLTTNISTDSIRIAVFKATNNSGTEILDTISIPSSGTTINAAELSGLKEKCTESSHCMLAQVDDKNNMVSYQNTIFSVRWLKFIE